MMSRARIIRLNRTLFFASFYHDCFFFLSCLCCLFVMTVRERVMKELNLTRLFPVRGGACGQHKPIHRGDLK